MSGLESQSFWPEIVRLKDELSLAELARRFGTTPGALSAAFERTAAAHPEADGGDDLPPEPGDGGPAVLPEVQRALESLREGSKDFLIASHAQLLGNVPDSDVAKAAGVSIRTIASFRSRHQIPGYSGPRRKPQITDQRRSRVEAWAHLLGKVPDHVIADKAGLTVHAVRAYRARTDAPLAPAEAKVTGDRRAWRVGWRSGLGRREAIVLGLDLDDVLLRLQRAGLGEIVGIEMLGPVLETT
jgi:hypothetical protein